MATTARRKTPTAIVRAVVEAMNERQLEEVRALCTPGFVGHVGGTDEDLSRFIFHEGELLHAFPDLRMSVEETVEKGTKIWVRLHIEGTHCAHLRTVPRSGRLVDYRGTLILRIQRDRIAELWANFDPTELLV